VPAPPYQSVVLSNAGVDILSGSKVLIQCGPKASVVISAIGILLSMGTNTLSITDAGIFLNGTMVTVQGASNVGVFAPQVRINS
jgi:hypothetical protein